MGRIRTLALLAATLCACATAFLFSAGVAAAASTPVTLDSPQNGDAPQVAYDAASSTTFIAWSDNQAPDNGVELCVLPASATACEGGGPVLLTVSSAQNPAITGDNTISLGALTVLPGGNVVVIGTPVSNSSVAWESPGDGSAFLTAGQGLQNGGAFISPVSLFYTTGNAVGLSATDIGLLDDYGDYFSDSPFAGPESPALNASNANQGNGGLFPRKSYGVDGNELAAEPAPAPAAVGTDIVVGVGDNYAGPNTPLPGCVNSAASGYGVSVGTVSGNSNAPGTLNGEGMPGYGLLACSAENPVVASGGQDGIGVLENEGNGISGAGSTFTMDYRPFVASASGGSFGAPVELAPLTEAASDNDVADDSGTGVYAMWDADGLHVDYSADGGATWDGAVVIPEPTVGSIGDPVITGVGDGTFVLAYTNNPGTGTEDFAETFSYQQLELAPTTLGSRQSAGAASGASISIPAGTVGETDRAVISGANATAATGTVAYALYKAAGCAPSALVSASTEPVTAGSAAASPAVTTALVEGTYYWKAIYSGDARNEPSQSSCGSEILTVTAAAIAPATATATSTGVTLELSCAITPCTVTVTITAPAAGTAWTGAGKKRAPKLITLAKGTFKVSSKGKHALKLTLTAQGKSLIKAHAKLGGTLVLDTKTKHGTFKSSHALKIIERR